MLFNTIILHKCEGKVLTSQAEPINLNQLKPKNNKPKINQKRKRQVHVIKEIKNSQCGSVSTSNNNNNFNAFQSQYRKTYNMHLER